jgi:biuret amidohydrolase
MRTIELEDHAPAMRALNEHLRIDPKKTAVVTIDMHRGHLDPVEATLPAPAEESKKVCRNAADLLRFARAQGIAVAHVIAVFREAEVNRINPRIAAARVVLSRSAPKTEPQRRGVPHNLQGSIQTELMPELGPEPSDYVIDNKKTFSSFQGTELDRLLRVVLEVDTVVLMGINTNTCVLCAAFEAFNLGYKTVVISDCVASMYGRDLHVLGLENVARCLGWVLTVDEFKEKIASS